MNGGGGGGDNAKIPLLMDCISSFKLLSFAVSLSDASSSSLCYHCHHLMLHVACPQILLSLRLVLHRLRFLITVLPFLLEIVDTKDRNLCHQTCTLSERNVSIPQISSKLRLQLLYNWVSHIFSFHLEG